MRLLIVDNGSEHPDDLAPVTAKYDVTIMNAADLSVGAIEQYVNDYDAIILTGDYDTGTVTEPEAYRAQIELVKSAALPLLGVALGFEIVCYALGAQLSMEADKDQAAGRIIPTNDGAKLFQGSDPIRVAESVRWYVEELPKGLQVLAKSETGIEAIKHKTQPIYGLQLRLADFTYPSDGKLVFDNVLSSFAKR